MIQPARQLDQTYPIVGLHACKKDGVTHVPLAEGGFAVCWQNHVADAGGQQIYIQVLDDRGATAGRPVVVNATPVAGAVRFAVASLQDGGCVVYWQEQVAGNSIGWGQRVDQSGHMVGSASRFTANCL